MARNPMRTFLIIAGVTAAAIVVFPFGMNYLLPHPSVTLSDDESQPPRIAHGGTCFIDDCQYGNACINNVCRYDPDQRVPNG